MKQASAEPRAGWRPSPPPPPGRTWSGRRCSVPLCSVTLLAASVSTWPARGPEKVRPPRSTTAGRRSARNRSASSCGPSGQPAARLRDQRPGTHLRLVLESRAAPREAATGLSGLRPERGQGPAAGALKTKVRWAASASPSSLARSPFAGSGVPLGRPGTQPGGVPPQAAEAAPAQLSRRCRPAPPPPRPQ